MKKDFHEIALQSILFKGRSDLYFCYLKSEKIAHVLVMLLDKSDSPADRDFNDLVEQAGSLPSTFVYFVAGDISAPTLLADMFSILTLLRLMGTKGRIGKETILILIQEYEALVRKVAAEHQLSPFLSANDFAIPEEMYRTEQLGLPTSPFISSVGAPQGQIKDTQKGQTLKKDNKTNSNEMVPGERMSLIFDFVKQNKGVSIKDIAAVVRNCSAKTIQRELGTLIEKGLVKREGERRWSLYFAALPE